MLKRNDSMSSGETKHDRLLKFIAGEKVDTFYLETIFLKQNMLDF